MALEDKERKGRTVLVAIDEGEHSIYALEWALDTLFIGTYPNDRIVAVYAKSPHSTLSGPAFVMTTDAIDSLERYDQLIVKEIKNAIARISSERQVNIELKVLTGDARDVISETAEELKADFLVMGSHGFGAIKRALLGSVSDYCAHHIKCPVLIVKKPADLESE